jgi:ATP-dependent protease ClpP protease subunit
MKKQVDRREILVFGTIEEDVARDFLIELRECRSDGFIPLVKICSGGGDLTAAMAMHDALADEDWPNTGVIATGRCMSSALAVLLGVPLGHRRATPNTVFMNHAVANVDSANLPEDIPVMEEMAALPLEVFGTKRAIEIKLIAGLAGE